MKKLVIICSMMFSHFAFSDMFGFNVGMGFPYLSQFGVNYVHSSNQFSAELAYNSLDITAGDVGVGINKTELSLRWHPFAGSFYVGAGIGQQKMYAKASETIATESIETKVDITSSTITPHLGWMWGASDGGFYFGMDFGYQSPSGAKSELTTNADASIQATQDYQDLVDDTEEQGEKYGEIGLPTMTLVRIGYLF